MAITTMDGVVAGLAASNQWSFVAPSFTNIVGGFINLQKASASTFGTLATPGLASAGGTLHVASDAGFPSIGAASSGLARYLGLFNLCTATAGTIHIYDRVWSCSGLVGNVATAQAISSFPTLVRPDSTGNGLELWFECYTAIGSTSANVTTSYTNSLNVASRTSLATATGASLPANRMLRLPLQAGDVGVKSVQSLTLSVTTGTAGNIGITLMKRIASIPCPLVNVNTVMDFAALGLPLIQDNAALQFVHQGTATSSGVILGSFNIVEG